MFGPSPDVMMYIRISFSFFDGPIVFGWSERGKFIFLHGWTFLYVLKNVSLKYHFFFIFLNLHPFFFLSSSQRLKSLGAIVQQTLFVMFFLTLLSLSRSFFVLLFGVKSSRCPGFYYYHKFFSPFR